VAFSICRNEKTILGLDVQLTSQYMVNSMVKLQFRVNDIALVSIRNSYDIDSDLDNLLKHISGRKHKLRDRVLRTDE
jgi:hypothetical protein